MTKTVLLSGAYSPIPTPFEDTGAVAHDKLAENIGMWSKTPLAGLLVLGSNGEFTYLSYQEKLEVLKTARDAIPKDKLFIAGAGCDSTRSSVDLTEQAAAIGADAAIIITPGYYPSKMDHQAMMRHYLNVADRSPLPILIYNMPANTGVDLSAETVVELSRHPNIVGIKDSSGNIVKVGEILRGASSDFSVLAGSASFLYPALVLGAVGGIMALGNIAPDECHHIFHYTQEDRHSEAQELQLKMIPANMAVTARFGVPGLKQALDWLGYYGGPPRSPLSPLNEVQQNALRTILIEGGILNG
jgi:4-hydroxy-2-oxoglutarate aldolase